MGFLDKAKQMAEQAQSKLDEVQKQFNETSSRPPGSKASEGPPVEYDQHGRATPPHGDPLGEQAPAPPAASTPDPAAPPAAATPDPAAPPATPSDPAADDEDPYAPPKLTGGDPLAG